MPEYTVGDFSTALERLVESLEDIAKDLKECEQEAEIDRKPGIRILCGIPVFVGETCVAPESPTGDFRVADLLVTVESIRDWVRDVRSRMDRFDSGKKLGSRSGPPPGDSQA